MIPLKDDVPSRSFPFVTMLIIAANCAGFLFELELGSGLDSFINAYGILPAKYFASGYMVNGTVYPFTMPDKVIPLFASMFLHGGWMHLLGNMLYLWIFGDNVEDRLGHFKFLIFYLACGLLAAFVHIVSSPGSTTPTIGASGAIAGVLGAYILLYPFARILVLVPIFIFIQFIRIPALLVLGFWFVMQFLNGSLALSTASESAGGVAWWAHIGGFVSGMVLLTVFMILFPSTRRRRA